MTARPERRQRSTLVALAAVVAAVAGAGALIAVGVDTLLDSTAGRRAAGQTESRPTQRLPYTPTGLLGTLDDTGRLTSLVVVAVEPDGTGGSIVQVAATADAGSGNQDSLRPLNAVMALEGPEALQNAAEAMTGVSFDVVELVDEQRVVQLIAPLGDLPVRMPITVYDESSQEQWPSGDIVLSGPAVARLLVATDPEIDDWLFEPGRAAGWRAIAERVGAGIGSATPVASDDDLARPGTADELLARLFAGSVQFRQLGLIPLDADRIAEQLAPEYAAVFGQPTAEQRGGVVVHDRSELLMVMGAVAPARIGAPLAAPNFRVESGFVAADLDPLGLRGSDVLRAAMVRLLFSRVNVVSVAELPGSTVPDHTTFLVADPDTVEGVREVYGEVFGGEIDVRVADSLIGGIDIVMVLGRDFVPIVGAELPTDVTSSSDDDSDG